MAKGYQLIQAQTLTSGAASITFANIPQNYTDLVLKVCARGESSAVYAVAFIRPNGATTNLSDKALEGTGSGVASYSETTWRFEPNGGTATANTFGNAEFYIPNYTSANYKTASGDTVTENNATGAELFLKAYLWQSTAAITSLDIVSNVYNFSIGSTFYLYGVGGTRATGGTITSDANYTYHTFTSSGTFTALEKIKKAEVLMVGGGGGGGSNYGGAGGAGGVVYATGQTLNAGTSYTAVIGAGGAAVIHGGNDGNVGNNTLFSSFPIALGGGQGAAESNNAGGSGGSGGGGHAFGRNNSTISGGSSTLSTGTNVVTYGNAGGSGAASGFTNAAGGGGGGAGAAGASAGTNAPGNGGVGIGAFSSWAAATGTGSSGYYAGGGGGGAGNAVSIKGLGGLGGGGNGGLGVNSGAEVEAQAGTANTGGGGGGLSNSSTTSVNAGGSGLVIVRYPSL